MPDRKPGVIAGPQVTLVPADAQMRALLGGAALAPQSYLPDELALLRALLGRRGAPQ